MHHGKTQRQARVGEVLRHALAGVLTRVDLRDPDLAGISITVTQVTVSPDLRNATAWVVPLGGRLEAEVVAALNRCARFLRGQLGHEVALKYTPRLRFALDASFDEGARIDRLLARPDVAGDLENDKNGA
jgi:ribosome-binding factor A